MNATKKMFGVAAMMVAVFVVSGFAQSGTRWLSRYWDGCKPTCSWREHAGNNLSKACDRSGLSVLGDPAGARCAKDGGTAYTCWDQIPFVDPNDPNLAYGFGATNGVSCGQCFEVTFDGGFEHGTAYGTHQALRGKKVIIMGRNTGSDVGPNQIDFMVPGGGLGQFDCFSGPVGVSRGDLGQTYGGFLADCETELRWGAGSVQQYQNCIRTKCDRVFSGTNHRLLRQGCNFYADFMMGANNPTGTVRTVTCPAYLTERYGGNSIVEPPTGGGGGTTYTITTAVNPSNGGSISRNPDRPNYTNNTSVTLTASPANGFTFTRWEAVSGSLPSGVNATNATATFNITSNVNIRAVFTQQQQTFTLTAGRNPTAGGTAVATIGGTSTNNPTNLSVNANTQVSIRVDVAEGYTFNNWTATSGSLPQGFNANTATAQTFTMTGNVNIRANFQQSQQITTHTLQVGRNPTSRGNVSVTVGNNAAQQNPTNAITVNPNTSITVTATATEGNEFVNWTTSNSEGLPAGLTATNATGTFTMTRNVNITANFRAIGTTTPTYTLTVGRNPSAGGSVIVNNTSSNPGPLTFNDATNLTISAQPNSGYTFVNWTAASGSSLPTGVVASNALIEFSISANVNIVANFERSSNGGSRDTTKVEAEDLTVPSLPTCNSSGNNPMCIGSNNQGVSNIGWIEGGNSATYSVNLPRTGAYTMVFRIASNFDQGASSFRVIVNGAQAGTISGHTGDWDGYTDVALSGDVQFNVGTNEIRLEFNTAVNVDYFLIIGEATASIRHGGTSKPQIAAARTQVTLSPAAGGFIAGLPAGHKWTSFKLIDLQGREIKRGLIGNGVTDLRFSNIKSGVVFLRLEGRGVKPTVLRATTVR